MLIERNAKPIHSADEGCETNAAATFQQPLRSAPSNLACTLSRRSLTGARDIKRAEELVEK
jgi:hypothetical protein